MLFLIDYDRDKGEVVEIREFDDSARRAAEDARLELEVSLVRRGVVREVVLLQAPDRAAIEQTHRRYFASLNDLARAASR